MHLVKVFAGTCCGSSVIAEGSQEKEMSTFRCKDGAAMLDLFMSAADDWSRASELLQFGWNRDRARYAAMTRSTLRKRLVALR